MKRTSFFLLLGLLTFSVASAQEIYRWTDDKGVIHFTDDPSLIPEKYQDQIRTEKIPVEPAPPAPPSQGTQQATPVKPPAGKTAEPSARKDVLGRGEDWWKAQAKMWREKLQSARKDYEAANAAVQAKQKEIDEAKFKPDSYKRKLEAEKKLLQMKANESAKRVEEAKNMLETGLVRQAEEYLADPNWVKSPDH